MHNGADQFAKNILREALSRASSPETEVEVLAATQKIDVYSVPDPARDAERAGMGLLGELSAEPSLFEPFHRTPGLRQVRSCLRKQLTWYHELERRARAQASPVGASSNDAEPDASTPEDAWERSVATPLLVHFRLGLDEQATSEEDDVSAEIRAWFEDYQQKLRNEGRDEGLKEGRDEGLKEGGRNLLLRQLRARFGELPAAVVARIDAADVAELERWGERMLGARTLDEVLGAPS
ncbi:DUF4351 domain-containing protein [Sorangium sp. So ce128]|uniref:DUF4351 domain-containing protein n=1 Tax=Sorangium sp. So ce128 TaxID=3133281 RepID=UPI003F607022